MTVSIIVVPKWQNLKNRPVSNERPWVAIGPHCLLSRATWSFCPTLSGAVLSGHPSCTSHVTRCISDAFLEGTQTVNLSFMRYPFRTCAQHKNSRPGCPSHLGIKECPVESLGRLRPQICSAICMWHLCGRGARIGL